MNWGHPGRGKVLLLAGDLTLGAAAVIFARGLPPTHFVSMWRSVELSALFGGTYGVCFYIFDLYDVQALNGTRTFVRLLTACMLGTCLLSLFLYTFQVQGLAPGTLGIAVFCLLASASAWRRVYKRHRSLLLKKRSLLFVGTPQDAVSLQGIVKSEHSPYEFCGFLQFAEEDVLEWMGTYVDRPVPMAAAAAAGVSNSVWLGGAAVPERASTGRIPRDFDLITTAPGPRNFGFVSRAKLEDVVQRYGVDTVVLRQNSAIPELAGALTELRFHGVRIATLPDLCGQILEELPVETLSDSWFSFATGFLLLHQKLFRKIKRLSDILFASAGLLLTLPISALVAIVVKLESPGPILFKQSRVGWMERRFTLLKFRSMRHDAEADGKPQWAAAMDPRTTRVGRVLRTLHIDEIPQMINVLLGDMSFVGPRPERPEFVEQLKQLVPFYSLRHHVPPGITGWAQVNYPYGASVEDAKRKLQYDLFYVRNASPTMDLRILLRTARVILFRRGSR